MNNLQEYVTLRREELVNERLRLRDAIAGTGGFTSPRAAQFMLDIRTRELLLEELERLGKWDESDHNPETPETPRRRPRREAA